MTAPKFITEDTCGHDPLIIRVTADMLTDNDLPELWKDLIRAYMSLSPHSNTLFCTGLKTIRRGLRIIKRAYARYSNDWDSTEGEDKLPEWYSDLMDEIPSMEDIQDDSCYGYAEASALLHPIVRSTTGAYSEQEKLKARLIIDLWEYYEFDEYIESALDAIDMYLEEHL